ncbi:hypothetical protein CR513_50060, partial [Mucuna pruriens]
METISLMEPAPPVFVLISFQSNFLFFMSFPIVSNKKLSKPSLFRLRLHLGRIRTDFVLDEAIRSNSEPRRTDFSNLTGNEISASLGSSRSQKTMINLNLRGQRSFGIVLGIGHVQVWGRHQGP